MPRLKITDLKEIEELNEEEAKETVGGYTLSTGTIDYSSGAGVSYDESGPGIVHSTTDTTSFKPSLIGQEEPELGDSSLESYNGIPER